MCFKPHFNILLLSSILLSTEKQNSHYLSCSRASILSGHLTEGSSGFFILTPQNRILRSWTFGPAPPGVQVGPLISSPAGGFEVCLLDREKRKTYLLA